MLMKKMFFVIAGAVFCLFSAIAEEGPSHECTSWMIFSDLTKNNTNILHKSRDSSSKNVTVLSSPAGAARKWIGLGSAKDNKIYVNMGMIPGRADLPVPMGRAVTACPQAFAPGSDPCPDRE